jgi:starch synthase
MVGRMVYQKGIDIAAAALPVLLEGGARFVILGDGDPAYVRLLLRSSHASPDRVSVFTRFDEALAHRIYAGADYFLMPSRYEPCGLGQMIAQRYGTPPVARRTGGLIDTVTDRKTGFLFDEPTPDALVGAVRRASAIWRVKGWNALRRRCMLLDRSWARSAEQYEAVYLAAQGIGRA